MKFFLRCLCVVVILTTLLSGLPRSVFAKEVPIYVVIDGERIEFDINPVVEKGSTFVQFRPLFEELGYVIEWDGNAKTITSIKEGSTILLTVNSNKALVNGKEFTLQTGVKTINGTTFVPLRFIAEASGAMVASNFNSITKTVYIFTDISNFLINAVMLGDYEKASEWLKKGANPNYADRHGVSAMLMADTNYKLMKLLLENGGDVNKEFSSNGFTGKTLNFAVNTRYEDERVIKMLVEGGGDLTYKDSDGDTAYDKAIKKTGITQETLSILSNSKTFDNAQGLQEYLRKKYPVIHTKLADVRLDITVEQNDRTSKAYDYYINFKYNTMNFNQVINSYRNSIKYAEQGVEDADLSVKQLKEFIEGAARDIILKLPNKKIKGNTEYSWYTYPNIRKELNIITENNWINYESIIPIDKTKNEATISIEYTLLDYKDTLVSDFQWMPIFDGLRRY